MPPITRITCTRTLAIIIHINHLSLAPCREGSGLLPECWSTPSSPPIGTKNSVPALWSVSPWGVQCHPERVVGCPVFLVTCKVEASSPVDWAARGSLRGLQGHDAAVLSPPSQLSLCKVSPMLHLPSDLTSWHFCCQGSVWSPSAQKARKEYSELREAPAYPWRKVIGWVSSGSHSH